MNPFNFVVAFGLLTTLAAPRAAGQIVLSGNENKIDLTSGGPRAVAGATPDSITVLNFAVFPPKTTTLSNIPNTVIGPPSNIAITPDGWLALIANSARLDPSNATNTLPNREIHVLDLKATPPQIIGQVTAGLQPSGMSITSDGKVVLVANRAAGTVSVLRIQGKNVAHLREVKVGEPSQSASDVAISPNGRVALVSLQKASVLAELKIDGEVVELTGRRFSAYGSPYRVVISPDGRFALTSGAGLGNGTDADAVSVIDLKSNPPRTVQHLTTGISPESLEISPDGKLVAVVTMEGSNLAPGHPNRTTAGGLWLYRRRGDCFELSQQLRTGRIPEGVAFTSDGKYLIVQCHPDRELRLYRVSGGKVKDTGERVKVSGMPSSLRAATK